MNANRGLLLFCNLLRSRRHGSRACEGFSAPSSVVLRSPAHHLDGSEPATTVLASSPSEPRVVTGAEGTRPGRHRWDSTWREWGSHRDPEAAASGARQGVTDG